MDRSIFKCIRSSEIKFWQPKLTKSMFLLIFFITFLATALSSMSGAGSTMITIPTWILIGYPLPVALAASSVNGALWTPIAAYIYLMRLRIDLLLSAFLIIFGLFGAYFGTKVVVESDGESLQQVLGIIILILVFFVFRKKEFGMHDSTARLSRLLTGILALPLGFYETFFGSGNGIFTASMLIKTRGFSLATSLGYYYLVSFFWCAFGAMLYLMGGFGDLSLIVPSSIGGMAGAFVGARLGRTKGTLFIRNTFLLLGSILGLKLALNI